MNLLQIIFNEIYPFVLEHDKRVMITVDPTHDEIEIAGSLQVQNHSADLSTPLYGEAIINVYNNVLRVCKWEVLIADPECFDKLRHRVMLCMREVQCTKCEWKQQDEQ